jgi:hypothetical protein
MREEWRRLTSSESGCCATYPTMGVEEELGMDRARKAAWKSSASESRREHLPLFTRAIRG